MEQNNTPKDNKKDEIKIIGKANEVGEEKHIDASKASFITRMVIISIGVIAIVLGLTFYFIKR